MKAMHREHAALGREVVRHRENTLLHLARVFSAKDDEFLVLEAEIDAGGRAHSSR